VDDTVTGRVRDSVRTLNPGYFALVMASGIISIGMRLNGFHVFSVVLLAVCAMAFVVLIVLTVWRIVVYRNDFTNDFTDPARGFGFFTFVAGTNVLATRLSVDDFHLAAAVLLVISFVAWLFLGYVVPWTSALGRAERPVTRYANGTWFIWVVASQSVATVAATIEPEFDSARRELALLAVISWSVGIILYVAVGVLVSIRMLTFALAPEDLTPPYWVSMGALAITVLAGARIVEMADAPMVAATRGLLAGLAVVFWAFATWLIPVLVAAGWWRHVIHRVPLPWDATIWSVIFPLGMYAVAGIYLGQADSLPVVGHIGSAELWVAFVAWVVAVVSMLVHLWRSIVRPATG
jgi:tellurite resistance protein TehA-like permease